MLSAKWRLFGLAPNVMMCSNVWNLICHILSHVIILIMQINLKCSMRKTLVIYILPSACLRCSLFSPISLYQFMGLHAVIWLSSLEILEKIVVIHIDIINLKEWSLSLNAINVSSRRGNMSFIYSMACMGCRADSRIAPSQWGAVFLCNDVSHWLGARLESALGWVKWTATKVQISCCQSSFIILLI